MGQDRLDRIEAILLDLAERQAHTDGALRAMHEDISRLAMSAERLVLVVERIVIRLVTPDQ